MEVRGWNTPVVVDTGSGWTKAGFAHGDLPRRPAHVFPTVVGASRTATHDNNIAQFVGKEAVDRRETLTLRRPIEHGIIVGWELLTPVIEHAVHLVFNTTTSSDDVAVCSGDSGPASHPFLMTEAMLGPKANRERLVQVMFETFGVPGFYVGIQASMALIGNGLGDKQTGLVVDSGFSVTHIAPVYQGYLLPHATLRLDMGGDDVTMELMKLLSNGSRGYSFTTTQHRDWLVGVKETLGYVAFDYEMELHTFSGSNSPEKTYQLPDGQTISVGDERFRCIEPMFKESTCYGYTRSGLSGMVFNSVMKCDPDIRQALLSNIVLAGGNTLMPGMADRLQKEVAAACLDADSIPSAARPLMSSLARCVKVHAPAERGYSAWLGASLLCQQSSFSSQWITTEEYAESGPSIVHRKCY
eukprot:TRINITY_DN16365_c0_g1_i1.p1 TRINITY_DN16365_c0_g1~~TRINITY_DN16365_c0_g1_i1.p1  ORF type:complete len:420 (-),score=43.12 TRINITY_DN16365_c0_g1_i1:45-1283(-)